MARLLIITRNSKQKYSQVHCEIALPKDCPFVFLSIAARRLLATPSTPSPTHSSRFLRQTTIIVHYMDHGWFLCTLHAAALSWVVHAGPAGHTLFARISVSAQASDTSDTSDAVEASDISATTAHYCPLPTAHSPLRRHQCDVTLLTPPQTHKANTNGRAYVSPSTIFSWLLAKLPWLSQ